MKTTSTIYPSLSRYFKTVQELADAGCMSRRRATDCLSGKKEFTAQEKQAIFNAILVKVYDIKAIRFQERVLTDFDEIFRSRAV